MPTFSTSVRKTILIRLFFSERESPGHSIGELFIDGMTVSGLVVLSRLAMSILTLTTTTTTTTTTWRSQGYEEAYVQFEIFVQRTSRCKAARVSNYAPSSLSSS